MDLVRVDGFEQYGPPIPSAGEIVAISVVSGQVYVEWADDETDEIETLTLAGGQWVAVNHGHA